MRKVILILSLVFTTHIFLAQPNFTTYSEGNPVIPKGIGTEWDASSLWWPNVSFIQDTFYLTYLGTDDFPNSPLSVGLATSTDGYNFTKHPTPILQANGSEMETYSVANGPLLKSGETWYLYYNGISADPSDPGKVIARANSSSPYGPWTRENDTLLTVGNNGAWDDAFVLPHSIIENGDELVMYYFGGDTWPGPFGQIGIAISTDNGSTWEKYPGNPILSPGPELFDHVSIFGASVTKSGNNWEMLYTGESNNEFAVCYATSNDGVTWKKQGVVLSPMGDPLSPDLYEGPSIVKNASGYFLYYDYGLQQAGIGLATAERLPGILEVPRLYSTIQEGIDASANGDTVLVAEGIYLENINFRGKAITVASHFILDQDTSHISKTIINGSQPNNPDSGSVVIFNSGEDTTSVICGFTITGGSGNIGEYLKGGGIFVDKSGAYISHNIIRGNELNASNSRAAGGGICCHFDNPGGKVTIIYDNTIIHNKVIAAGEFSSYGGGIDVRNANARIIKNKISQNEIGGGDNCYGPGIKLSHSNETSILDSNTISFNYFSNSQSQAGGLFLFDTKDVKVTNNHFEENSGTVGAGIADLQTNNTIIADNDFLNNTAEQFGGGLYDYQSNNTIISNNSFLSNTAEQFGGALYLEGSDVNLYNNTIKYNHSMLTGGGIYFNNVSNSKTNNNLIAYNNALMGGGGISFVANSHPELINNTIVENTAERGGGLSFLMNSNPIIMNTILYDNKADSSGSQVYVLTEDCEPTFTYCNIEGGIADFGIFENAFPFPGTYENNIENDPLFADDSTFYLSVGSPCIDTGNPDEIYNDENGTRNDIGCYGGPGTITSIKEIISENGQLPNNFKLFQNYPNPFNPSTTIKYSIPSRTVMLNSFQHLKNGEIPKQVRDDNTNVLLKVYDILGREVKTLVNQKQKPGNYEVNWEANDQPSGVYFYQLETGSFRETKKMILLR